MGAGGGGGGIIDMRGGGSDASVSMPMPMPAGDAAAAVMLGVSLSGMKSRVQRGRVKLRELFQACCEITVDPRGRVIGYERRPDWKPLGGCCS